MKLVTHSAAGRPVLGIVVEERIFNLAESGAALGLEIPDSMVAFLEAGPSALASAKQVAQAVSGTAASVPFESADLLAPVPRPPKLLALAGNYMKHVVEGRGAEFEKRTSTPRPFIIPSSSVIGCHGHVVIPSKVSTAIDYELELAVVIGVRCRDVSPERAPDHVAGYTIFNDISARRLSIAEQREPRNGDGFYDWLLGKWPDTFAPMGPCLVTADEVGDPHDLSMKLRVNGDLRQDAGTAQMVWNCFEVIAFISQYVTLEPGDVIATGTPAGVGGPKGVFLKNGDVIEGEIEGLGRLVNRVVDHPLE